MNIERITFEIEDTGQLDVVVAYIRSMGAKNVKVKPITDITMADLLAAIEKYCSQMAEARRLRQQ